MRGHSLRSSMNRVIGNALENQILPIRRSYEEIIPLGRNVGHWVCNWQRIPELCAFVRHVTYSEQFQKKFFERSYYFPLLTGEGTLRERVYSVEFYRQCPQILPFSIAYHPYGCFILANWMSLETQQTAVSNLQNRPITFHRYRLENKPHNPALVAETRDREVIDYLYQLLKSVKHNAESDLVAAKRVYYAFQTETDLVFEYNREMVSMEDSFKPSRTVVLNVLKRLQLLK